MPRVLLDQNVPAGLARLLVGHTAVHASQLGWGTLSNGDLIAAAERNGFAVMVTADTSIRYQQNLSNRRITLVVLQTNHWPTLRTNVQRILEALAAIAPAGFVTVPFGRERAVERPRSSPDSES